MSAINNSQNKQRNKRKRKKSFLKNARKYGKKGCYGRGAELDEDSYQYFVKILEILHAGVDSKEEKELLAKNVFEQTTNRESNCCCNQIGSKVVEGLLPFASDEVLDRFLKIFSDDLRVLCCDRFASHTLEVLVNQTYKLSLNNSEKHKIFFLKVCKFLLNNLEDFIWDTYANHVIRTCLNCIQDTEKSFVYYEEYLEIVEEYANRLIQWPQFGELVQMPLTAGFLQIILKVSHKILPKYYKMYMNKLINNFFAPEDEKITNSELIRSAFNDVSTLILLEEAIELSNEKFFVQIFVKCFQGKLVKLSKMRSTHYSVKKLIKQCYEKTDFESIFDELKDNFKDIIFNQHDDLILTLGEGCVKFSTRQSTYLEALLNCFDCNEPEERQNKLILCLCYIKDFNDLQKTVNLETDKLSTNGTMIVQLLLDFKKPIKIINSILNLSNSDLKGLLSSIKGSHITDSFVNSKSVGEKSREKLIKQLKGSYQYLAHSKGGSRSFEAIWSIANETARLNIMEELSKKDASWSHSSYGIIIANKINLKLYKKNKAQWKDSLDNKKTSIKMFDEIIEKKNHM